MQDAWGLGHILWTMLSADPAAGPFPGGGAYAAPPLPLGGRPVDAAAAAAIVRGLLRPAPGERWSLDEAVAGLEAMLFVLPGLDSPRAPGEAISRRCVCGRVVGAGDAVWGGAPIHRKARARVRAGSRSWC